MMAKQSFSSAISGVLYAEDFDDPVPRLTKLRSAAAASPAPEPELIAPTFSLAELKTATEQALAEGRELERKAASQSQGEQRNKALTELTAQLRQTTERSTTVVEQNMEAIARTVLSFLVTALPSICTAQADREIRTILARILPTVRQLPELHIRVNPSMRQVIEGEIAGTLEGAGTQIVWAESDKLMLGDMAVTWQNGSAVRDISSICASIRDALLSIFSEEDASLPSLEDQHG